MVARRINGAGQGLQCFFIGVKRRPPTAFIGHTGEFACSGHESASRVVNIGHHHQRFIKTLGAQRHDQKILDIDPSPGMGATAKNLNFWEGQTHRLVTRQIAPQGQVFAGSCRLQHRQRGGDGGVGTQAAFQRRAVQSDECVVYLGLIASI